MEANLEKLASLGGPPLGPPALAEHAVPDSRSGTQLAALLRRVNGFYAFESALHVFAGSGPCRGRDVAEWNDHVLWRQAYDGMADGMFFFAEDIFGVQFAIKEDAVCSFDPETAEVTHVAVSLEDWAAVILRDYEMLTGYPLARAWQLVNGPIKIGSRLLPKTPFVLDGDFSVANLITMDSVRGMLVRAELATRIRDLPDGATVRFVITE